MTTDRSEARPPSWVVWRAALATLLAFSSVSIAADRQPPRYTETVDVASVLIDVRALDDKGAAILGLEASDFNVRIAGKPVRVQSSAWIGGGTTHLIDEGSTVPPAGAMEPQTGRLIVLLFQRSLANYHARGLIRTLEQSRELLRDLGPSDRVAILTFDTRLVIWTDFTNDAANLDRILQRGVLFEKAPRASAASAPSLVERLDLDAGHRAYTIERAFELIAQALRPLPGSKTIAFFGHGMGRMNPRGDMSAAPGYDKARNALAAARATVFSLDIAQADSHSLQYGLQRIAEETGGFYAHSLDFPERPMRWLAGALSGYYVLFVERPQRPAAATDISVTLKRGDGHVFATAGYSNPRR
jgi:VWFA-related protein